MKPAYYNEFDKQTAAWLRELIRQGHIAPGDVDERSIEDVNPDDLRGYTQCHFFAGIGVWPYALRRAGWPDDRPIWTGSCPCQPFSAAGKGAAFDDERHLWPAFHHLIKVGKPATILGEQVASKAVDHWVDLVQTDMEALGYAFGACAFPSAGVGAPHIRDRTYWVADADSQQCDGRSDRKFHVNGPSTGRQQGNGQLESHSENVRMADADSIGRTANAQPQFQHAEHHVESRGGVERMANTECEGIRGGPGSVNSAQTGVGDRQHLHDSFAGGNVVHPSPTNGIWRDADWLHGRDGKWRPVEPGTFPLAYGLAAGMGKLSAGEKRLASLAGLDAESLKRAKSHRIIGLRGAGNAINAEAAIAWIETVMECIA